MNHWGKKPPTVVRRVWRVTAGVPSGEWVDPAASPPQKPDAPEMDRASWAMSSFDLRYGADITDVSDTISPDLLDQLFPPSDDPPKRRIGM